MRTAINDILVRNMNVAGLEDTPENRLSTLEAIRSDWNTEESVSEAKDVWIAEITKMIEEMKTR